MPKENFEALPASMEVREVHLLIQQPGFRPQEIILVTTLVDPKRYPKAKLAHLASTALASHGSESQAPQNHVEDGDDFGENPARWCKRKSGCKCLHTICCERVMWQSAQHAQVSPRRISLQRTRQQFNQFRPLLAQATDKNRRQIYMSWLEVIPDLLVPLRPNRVEPRVVKRRPKPFPRMQKPRERAQS
jgi:hypothetical protein